MNLKQLEKANALKTKIERCNAALETIAQIPNNEREQQKCYLQKWDDGSGWSVSLWDIIECDKFIDAVEKIVLEKKEQLEKEFEAI